MKLSGRGTLAVSAIASEPQQRTISAMSHLIARSESVSAPTSSMGALLVSICLPLATTLARSARKATKVPPPAPAHPRVQRGPGAALL
jgi:hypothetical protein